MKINGVEVDMEKAAQAIAAAYVAMIANPNYVPRAGEIDDLLKAYLCTYTEVISKDHEFLLALVE